MCGHYTAFDDGDEPSHRRWTPKSRPERLENVIRNRQSLGMRKQMQRLELGVRMDMSVVVEDGGRGLRDVTRAGS